MTVRTARALRALLALLLFASGTAAAQITIGVTPGGSGQPYNRPWHILIGGGGNSPDSFNVVLSGVGASTTAWTATHNPAHFWATLTTAGGTGSGVMRYAVSASGIPLSSPGIYIDTVFFNAPGASQVIAVDTLVVTNGVNGLVDGIPVNGLSGAQGSGVFFLVGVPSGAASVTIATSGGTGDVDIFCRANLPPTMKQFDFPNEIGISTYIGGNAESCTWNNPAPGQYVVMLQGYVAYSGVTLLGTVTMQPNLAAYQNVYWDALPPLGPAFTRPDTGFVDLIGPNASTTNWGVAHRSAATWNTFIQAAGMGPGTFQWNRNPDGLAPGIYVDTFTVTANAVGSPVIVVDTLVIAPPAQAVTIGVPITGVSDLEGGARFYQLNLPAAVSNLSIDITGFSGDPDLHTMTGLLATSTRFNCRPYAGPNTNENCTYGTAGPGFVSIMLHAYEAYTNLTLTVTHQAALTLQSANPLQRSYEVAPVGSTTPLPDSINLGLSGSGAGAVTWMATHRPSATWLTIGDAGGSGSSVVHYSRNPTGLTQGMYIDTITVTAPGATGSPAIIVDTFVVHSSHAALASGVPQPLSGTAGSAQLWFITVPAGTGNLQITLSGGTGNADLYVKLGPFTPRLGSFDCSSRNPSGSDICTFANPAAGSWEILVQGFTAFNNVNLTATLSTPTATLAVSRIASTGWDAGLGSQSNVRADSLAITLSGSTGASTGWSVFHSASATWVTPGTNFGTGSGRTRWTRNPSGLAPGVYVDTITVLASSAGGSPTLTYDTLAIAAPVTVLSSGVAMNNLSGGPGSAAYFSIVAPPNTNHIIINVPAGTGNVQMSLGPMNQVPDATTNNFCIASTAPRGCGLGPPASGGTFYVLLRGLTGYSGYSIDATVYTATLTLFKDGEWHAVPSSVTATGPDSIGVNLTGTGASTVPWTIGHRAAATWNSIMTGMGTGPGLAYFTRSSNGLAPGVYIDTFAISAGGLAAQFRTFIDTLVVTAAPTVLTSGVAVNALGGVAGGAQYFTINAPAGTTQLTAATSGGTGGVYLYVLNPSNVSQFQWFAASEAPNTTVQSTGFFSPTGLLNSQLVYVMVRGSGSFSNVSLTATVATPLGLAVSANVRRDSIAVGSTALRADSVDVVLGGTGAGSANWTASHRAAATWNSLTTAGGTGSGKVRWNRNPTGLAMGVYVDSILVTAAGATGSPALIVDSLVITAASATLALGISSNWVGTIPGPAFAGGPMQVPFSLTGSSGGTTSWTATHRAGSTWNVFTQTSGTGSGQALYVRDKTGLSPGTYLDTIVITAPGAAGSPAIFVDSLIVGNASASLTNATPLTNLGGSAGFAQFYRFTIPAGQSLATVTTSGGTGNVQLLVTQREDAANGYNCGSSLSGTAHTCQLGYFGQSDTLLIVLKGQAGGYSGVSLVATYSTTATLSINPAAAWHATWLTGSRGSDSLYVSITGPNTPWTVSHRASAGYDTLVTTSGMGQGIVYWTRAAHLLAPGVYIDTISVASAGATGSPALLIDTVVMQAPTGVLVPTTPRTVGSTGSGADIYLLIVPAGTTAWSVNTSGGTGSVELLVSSPQQLLGFRTGCRSANAGTVQTCGASIPGGTTSGDTLTVILHGSGYSGVTLAGSVTTPLMISLVPGSRRDSALVGATNVRNDSATVLLSGTGSVAAVWSATHRAAATWVSLTTSGGMGTSSQLRWTRNPTGLAAGVYIDTISVAVSGAANTPMLLIDSLVVTAPLSIAVSRVAAWDAAPQGGGANGLLVASVTLNGTGATGATAVVSHRAAATWTTINQPTGPGSFTLAWNHAPGALTPGLYIDTLSIAVAGASNSPVIVVDTFAVGTVVGTVSLATPQTFNNQAQATPGGVLYYVLNAPVGSSAVTVATTGGTGNADLYLRRIPPQEGAGSQCVSNAAGNAESCGFIGLVDGTWYAMLRTIAPYTGVTVTASVSSALTMFVTPRQKWNVMLPNAAARNDSLTVQLAGTNASTSAWTAAHRTAATWLTLTNTGGTGTGSLRWSRNPAGLAAGVYVDSLVVTTAGATGSPDRLIDTLVVTPAQIALTSGQAVSVAGPAGSATYYAITVPPNATQLQVVTSGGTGDLDFFLGAPGTTPTRATATCFGYNTSTTAETCTINAPSAGDWLILAHYYSAVAGASLTATVTANLTLTVIPSGRRDSATVGSTAVHTDSAAVQLTGTGGSATTWTATHGATATWVTLTTAGGTGTGTVRWSRALTGLAVGTYIDTITVTAAGAAGSPAQLFDTLYVFAATPITLALTPGVRRDTIAAGATGTRADSAAVTLTGTGGASATWTATHRAAATWITFNTSGGTGSGTVRWTRAYTGLAAGTYVDTITVAVAGAVGSPAKLVDTLVVNSALTLAITAATRHRDSTFTGLTGTRADSATFTIGGPGGTAAAWTATHRAAATWVTLTSASGAGSGKARWSRNYAGLAAGTFIDTITITVAGAAGSPLRVVDTLVVASPPAATTAAIADAILGGAGLTGQQGLYLDALGNKNGQFDLGDFLAWVTTHPNGISGETIAAVMDTLREREAARRPGGAREAPTPQQRKGGRP